jgi:hypothetical protein
MTAQHRNPYAPARSGTIPVALGRLALLPLLLLLLPLFPGGALGKGGTNMHEFASTRAGVPNFTLPPANQTLTGCGRGR